MASESVYSFLFCVFVCCFGADVWQTQRISIERPFHIGCCFASAGMKVEDVEWMFSNSYQGEPGSTTHEVIFRYSLTEKKGTHGNKKKYENEFNTTGMRDYKDEKLGKTCVSLQFRISKTWHSGTYLCRYRNRQGQVLTHDEATRVVFRIFEHRLQITPCERGEDVELRCEAFGLDILPETVKFHQRGLEYQNVVYTNIIKAGEYYNVTGKTFVPRGDLGETIGCQITPESIALKKYTHLERKVNLTKQMKNEDNKTTECSNVRMDKRLIWEEAGETNLTLRCTFDKPNGKEVTNIEWLYHDAKETHLMYNWTKNTGQQSWPNYDKETFTSIEPVPFKGRTATSVTFETAMLNHTGNYTCNVIFGTFKQSDTAVLVVYQLKKHTFTAIGCSDQKVRLECNASEVHPEPEKMVLSLYDPKSNSTMKLNHDAPKWKTQADGLFEISVKTITSIGQRSPSVSPENVTCDVVLSSEFGILETSWTDRKTYVTDSRGIKTDVCYAKVEMEPHLQWKEAGSTEVSMRCYFEIPQKDEIESIELLHNEFHDQTPFYTWEKRRNNSGSFKKYKDQILNLSSLMPHVHGSGNSTTLQFKNVTFEHQGKYLCRVNYTIAGSHKDNATLVVYELSKPSYFKATRCSDNQTVGLECRASNIRPRPIEVAFYVYDPSDNSSARLDTDVYIDIAERKESLAISAKMIARIQWSRNKTLRAKCEVILHSDISKSASTDLEDPDTSGNSECSPNLRADKHRLWEKVGEDVVFRCTFNVPFRRRISSVEWISQSMSRALFKWEANRNITEDHLNMSFALTQDLGGRNVTTLTIGSAKIEHSGNYTCRINYGPPKSSQSDTSLLVVYRVSRLVFSAVGCSNKKVRLECMADSVHPAPVEVAFFFYDPTNDSLLKLNSTVPPESRNEVNGLYNVTTKMFTQLDQRMAAEMSPTFMCRMVLSWDPPIVARSFAARTTFVVDFRGVHVDVCSPKVTMELQLQWVEAGTSPVVIHCRFDLPRNDKIESIEWFHQNASTPFNLSLPEGKITNVSWIIEGEKFTTLKLDRAKIEHSGQYLCRVNYVIAGNPSGTGHLVVYQTPILTAIGCTDKKVRLVCKVNNVFPWPEEISLRLYDPELKNSSSTLKSNRTSMEGEGPFNITLETIALVDKLVKCYVILSREFGILTTKSTKRERYVKDSSGNVTDTCLAKVKMEPRLQWKKASSTDVSMRCSFEIPPNDEIVSIEWLHKEFDDQTPFYTWEKRKNNSGSFKKYKDQILSSSSLIPHVHGSGNSTALQFKNVTFENQGKYLCRVNYLIAGPHEDNATLVVYELSKPSYFKATRCSDNQTVGLECRASNIRPRPIEVAFYVYDPSDNSSARLDTDVYIDIAERKESFAISAKMIARIQWSRNKTLRAKCEVILHRDISKSASTDLEDPDTSGNSECSPNLRADKHRLWEKVGEDVVFRCTFNVPFRRRISSVEWISQSMSRALFKWEANRNITEDHLNMSFALTQDLGGRNVTTLTIGSAKIEHSGNYTCRINYGPPKSSQSDTSLLVVYHVSRLDFTAVGCSNKKVRLECMADSVHPAPVEVAFFFYDPTNDSLLKLNSTVPPESRNEVNGLYNVTTKMFTQLDQRMAAEMSPTFMCRMVLSWDPPIVARSFAARTTFVVDFRGVHVDVCSPKVTVEPHLRWVEFGTSPVVIHCRFDLPINDEIESIEWFHQNTSALFNLSQPEGKITKVSLKIEGDKFWTLKLDKAKIKYNGSYLCRVNYVLAGNPSGYGHLVVYRIEKPYHFETIPYGDGEALLECKAGNLFPEPKRIVFFKYDLISKLKTKFIQKPVSRIFQVNGFYNINAHITIETGESESVQYVCDVVLSEDPKIEESTLLSPTTTTSYYTPDDNDKPNITGKGEISPKYVIIGGSIGGLLLGSCLAYLLYAYICKRLCHAWQDESSNEKKKKKKKQ